ncbi:MAG: hypothetical protein ACK5AZ_11650 [Bryobacteraceae bacterium]
MARTGSIATTTLVHLLQSHAGVSFSLAAVSNRVGELLAPIQQQQIVQQHVPIEVAEKSTKVQYPILHVYCERIENRLKEKFRTFSGSVRLALEVRVTQEHLEGLDRRLHLYLEALTDFLDRHRGEWGEGMYFSGAYEASIGPVRRGGKNFVHIGKVTLDVDVSSN